MRWPYDLAQTKTLAETAQSVITALAIAVGGGWALYHFVSLHKIEIASEELIYKKLQNEREPVIEIRVDASVAVDPDTQMYWINAVATLNNKGSFPEELDFSEPVFMIRKTHQDDNGLVEFGEGIETIPSSPFTINAANIMPGESQQYSLMYSVKDTGIYYIQFAVNQSERASQQWKPQDKDQESNQLVWYHGIFITVGKASD
jgi:hypothetical protein